jgi:hypothetical protein
MKKYLTQEQVTENFLAAIEYAARNTPGVSWYRDACSITESYINYTDSLEKDGQVNTEDSYSWDTPRELFKYCN